MELEGATTGSRIIERGKHRRHGCMTMGFAGIEEEEDLFGLEEDIGGYGCNWVVEDGETGDALEES